MMGMNSHMCLIAFFLGEGLLKIISNNLSHLDLGAIARQKRRKTRCVYFLNSSIILIDLHQLTIMIYLLGIVER